MLMVTICRMQPHGSEMRARPLKRG